MQELARKELQTRYVEALIHLNGLSESLAWYYADRVDEQAMRIQIKYYENTQQSQ